ncbi:hypothetical protein G6F58_013446 [Rhizopus delemar]|nr:hypothetical protein G6F58_013446 [Rhizopus delemar]
MASVSRPTAMRCRASIRRWQHAAAQRGPAAGTARCPAQGGRIGAAAVSCGDATTPAPADQYRDHRVVARRPAARAQQPGRAPAVTGALGAAAKA